MDQSSQQSPNTQHPSMIIESPANPTVKTLRSLEQAKSRDALRLFLVEGVRAVEEGLESGFLPAICLYNADLLKSTERGGLLLRKISSPAIWDRKGAAILEATPRALEAAGSTMHPQGIVAAFPFLQWGEPSTQPDQTPLALICDNIQDPGNLGTIMRTAEAAGITALWLSPGSVDQYNPKVVRAAMGAHFRLPIYAKDWSGIADDIAKLDIPNSQIFATDAGAAQSYDVLDWTQPAALIISNEAHGPSAEARSLAGSAGGVVAIPMLGQTESLNAATAAAIVLFEAARQRRG